MKVVDLEADTHDEVLDRFSDTVEELSLQGDIEGLFLFVDSKSGVNKSVFILGDVDLERLAALILQHVSSRDKNFN